jgi:hypothetical protein
MKAGRYRRYVFLSAPDRAFRSNWYGLIVRSVVKAGQRSVFLPIFSECGLEPCPDPFGADAYLTLAQRISMLDSPHFSPSKIPTEASHIYILFPELQYIQDDTAFLTVRLLCNTFDVPSWPRFWWPAVRALADDRAEDKISNTYFVTYRCSPRERSRPISVCRLYVFFYEKSKITGQ